MNILSRMANAIYTICYLKTGDSAAHPKARAAAVVSTVPFMKNVLLGPAEKCACNELTKVA